MKYLSRRTKTILVFLILVTTGYGVARFLQGENNRVPQDFTDARLQGAAIAENIVTLSTQSTNDLGQVNQYDKSGDYTDALTLTTKLVAQSQEIRNQAIALSTQVGDMAKALSSINSQDARQAALDAITNRLALVDQLVNYSNDLDALLNTLRNRFVGQPTTAGSVQALVNKINTDVAAVNNFNAQATQSMAKFDAITAK